MPRQAHDIVFSQIKDDCLDSLRNIASDLPDTWYADMDQVEEGEWMDRDGFWSYNNGCAEFCFPGDVRDIYYSGHGNPFIQKLADRMAESIVEAARKMDGCPAGSDDDVLAWAVDNHPELEDDEISYSDEYPPFAKASYMLKDTDGRQFTGPVDDDTVLDLHFRFGYNDDFGYGRSWCQGGYYGPEGFGDRDILHVTIRFTLRDIEWVKEQIAGMAARVHDTPDSTVNPPETVLESPSIKK